MDTTHERRSFGGNMKSSADIESAMRELKMQPSDAPAYKKYWRAYFRRMAKNLAKPLPTKWLKEYMKK